MTKIALLGAGGKMGVRLAKNFQGSEYDVDHVETSTEGQKRLQERVGVACVPEAEALRSADIVVMAVPDRLIGTILSSFVATLRPATAVIMLDAAAPHAGKLPERADITYFVTHPCHPPIFNDETDSAAKHDFFGGEHARQNVVCALMQGPEEHYARCEAVVRTMFKPVMRTNRCTVEQIAILEPALSETVGATFCLALREAADEAVRRGVPRQAAHDFILGHLTIELSIAFGIFPEGRFSDGALKAISAAKSVIFQPGWLEEVFDPVAVKRSVEAICA